MFRHKRASYWLLMVALGLLALAPAVRAAPHAGTMCVMSLDLQTPSAPPAQVKETAGLCLTLPAAGSGGPAGSLNAVQPPSTVVFHAPHPTELVATNLMAHLTDLAVGDVKGLAGSDRDEGAVPLGSAVAASMAGRWFRRR